MTTICSFCGKLIDEENEKNINKKYLLCKNNCGFTPKGAMSYKNKLKGGNNMEEKKVKVKKEKKFGAEVENKIVELAKAGKSPKEISDFFKGHPAVPKVKRVLKAKNIVIKKVEKTIKKVEKK